MHNYLKSTTTFLEIIYLADVPFPEKQLSIETKHIY
jgi:hypothetical protein